VCQIDDIVYFTYFEEARSYYFDQLAPLLDDWPSQEEDQLHPGAVELTHTSRIQTTSIGAHYGALIKENECVYNLPLIRSDRVEIGVRVTRVGRSSFVMEQQVSDNHDHERIFAVGKTVMVRCNYHTSRPVPVPPLLRAAIERMEGRSFPLPE